MLICVYHFYCEDYTFNVLSFTLLLHTLCFLALIWSIIFNFFCIFFFSTQGKSLRDLSLFSLRRLELCYFCNLKLTSCSSTDIFLYDMSPNCEGITPPILTDSHMLQKTLSPLLAYCLNTKCANLTMCL